ncbi:MAG: CopG family transcriptional regulator [Gemmatimonadetes bacterium]|nr:CopG family transcriptional regulator [Gemmatimonadota bacterium]
MGTKSKRTTVYFSPTIHRALRLKAAETDQSVSDLVNAAVRESLAEDAEDLEAFEARAAEPSLLFEDVLEDLRRRGEL